MASDDRVEARRPATERTAGRRSMQSMVERATMGNAVTLIKWSEEAGQVRLSLPSDLDLPMAHPLVDSLRHGFATADRILVEADAVERVSTACVQALLAAARQASDTGQAFVIARPSEVLVEACDDLGLAAWLKQWSQS